MSIAILEENEAVVRTWWHKPVIPTILKVSQMDQKFKASLSYTENSKPAWVT